MKVCVTIDMDDYRDYRTLVDRGGDASDVSFYGDAVPRFLDILDAAGVRATFFLIGRHGAVPGHARVVREIAARGHEVANHSWSHPYNFRALSRAEKIAEIERGDATIADLLGERPVGFRTPSCDVDWETLELLAERGYLYDSSVFPTPVMWAFMVYGKLFVRRRDYQLGAVHAVFAPRVPYVPRAGTVHRRADPRGTNGRRIVEIPVSVVLPAVRIPFYSTMLRLLGTRGFDGLVGAHRGPLLHCLFHLIEVADLHATSLGRALERTPGLGLPLARRTRFVNAAVARLARAGEAVTMRELARAWLAAEDAA
jgi:hypothetical protein